MTTKKALAQLMLVFIEGRNYETQNPYTRPEIKDGFKALGFNFHDEGASTKLCDIAKGRRISKRS